MQICAKSMDVLPVVQPLPWELPVCTVEELCLRQEAAGAHLLVGAPQPCRQTLPAWVRAGVLLGVRDWLGLCCGQGMVPCAGELPQPPQCLCLPMSFL